MMVCTGDLSASTINNRYNPCCIFFLSIILIIPCITCHCLKLT